MISIDNERYYKRVFAKKQEYKGITFNSALERDFAMFLDGAFIKYKGTYYFSPKIIEWKYEPVEFELIPQEEWIDKTEIDKSVKTIKRNKKHTLQRVVYTPDFLLPEYNLLVETKGVQFDDALFHLRLRLFKHKYPNYKIWVVRHHDDFDKLSEVLEAIKIGENNNE